MTAAGLAADNVAAEIVAKATTHGDQPALMVDGRLVSYEELLATAARLAVVFREWTAPTRPFVAVTGFRSFSTYASILGALLAGRAYVPLNPSFPAERSAQMVQRAKAGVVVVTGAPTPGLQQLLRGLPSETVIIDPAVSAQPEWGADTGRTIITAPDLPAAAPVDGPEVDPESPAYLLFTSGTTGQPKGIAVALNRLAAYLRATSTRYELGPGDRCSQNFALTFDLSVHDLFLTWTSGACLCVVPERSVMAPGAFVKEWELTSWFSTPTTAAMMNKLRMLAPNAFPSLTRSLFCGEALPAALASAWAEAAPNSLLDNLYGPTEATIACTAFRFEAGDTSAGHDLVPIGRPFGRTRTAVVDDQLRPVPAGQVGELVLGGPQVASGYWEDPVRTAASFVSIPELGAVRPWYRTGDRVVLDDAGVLHYRGRVDDQLKIRGYRVELGEIEAVLRRVSGAVAAVAVGWPRTASGADGVIAFTVGGRDDGAVILDECRNALPDYMVPNRIVRVEAIPQNASGKTDRRRLIELHEGSMK